MLCNSTTRKQMTGMVGKHYDLHHKFPVLLQNEDGTSRFSSTFSPQQIHQAVVYQIYQFCRDKNLVFVWVYLYSNWYTINEWNTWARSTRDAFPSAKTTMMVESHWRVLKRVDLLNHNRPDYLVFKIISKTCAKKIRQFNEKIARRVTTPSWENDFRSEWATLASRELTDDGESLYEVDTARWVCGCPYFVHSRFLLCKHLVSSRMVWWLGMP
ncbi:hypothetical protein DM01DRAFT_1208795 [Hesseltinella vesiculosa]|uniref:SWIM-type domain-containing protein n=1 Tax=Hesseltinella vesiculosa TaxID=101127 RepID=A0A1X2GQ76_9FUNG|nr:hypothetical protein DM01DRAFT_1208795 [Hesseltinella vesiculosa]